MDPRVLWNLPPEKFNEWRIKHDYPALFTIFKKKLSHYDEWLESESLSPEILFRHGFSRFISAEEELVLCEYKQNNKYMLFEKSFKKLDSIRNSGWIKKEDQYKPYFFWLERNYGVEIHESTKREFRISSWIGGRPQFLKEHFLLNLGGVELKSPILSGRLLDFSCLDNLKITGAVSNTHLYLWHCSAIGLEISGGLAFLDFYDTKLWSHGYFKEKQELTLKDGVFQDFHFKGCDLRFHASRSTLMRCSITGKNFDATLEHTKIDDFIFRAEKSKSNPFHSRSKFYAKAKNFFSSVGNKSQAGDNFFKEKKRKEKKRKEKKRKEKLYAIAVVSKEIQLG